MNRSAMPSVAPPWLSAHVPWSPDQVRHARFVRFLALTGRISDGESIEQLAATHKLQHQMIPDAPRNWNVAAVQVFMAPAADSS